MDAIFVCKCRHLKIFHVANLFIKPENREKTGFVMFSGGIERDRWHWNGLNKSYIF